MGAVSAYGGLSGSVPCGPAGRMDDPNMGRPTTVLNPPTVAPAPSYAEFEGDHGTEHNCKATTKKGNPCDAIRLRDGDYCIGHQRAEDARIAREG